MIVEFTFVAPLFFTLIFAIVDFYHLFYASGLMIDLRQIESNRGQSCATAAV